MAHNVALEAESWMTPLPTNAGGRPNNSTSQSSTCVSSSVQAGDVDHNIPCTPSPDDTRSPRTEGPEAFAGKYPKKLGDCQCVTPGSTTRSRSLRIASHDSPCSGAAAGSAARTD